MGQARKVMDGLGYGGGGWVRSGKFWMCQARMVIDGSGQKGYGWVRSGKLWMG